MRRSLFRWITDEATAAPALGGPNAVDAAEGGAAAPPRRPPTRPYRWTGRRKAAAVVLALSCGFGYRWYDANVLPDALQPPATETPLVSSPNAAHFYAAAADALTPSVLSGYFYPEDMTLEEQAVVVREDLRSLALLRQGMRHPYLGNRTNWLRSPVALGPGAPEPDVTNQRALSRLLLTDARVMAARGDAVGALQASLDALRFGQDVGQDDTPVAGLLGALCEREASAEAVKHVYALSAEDARTAARRLECILLDEQAYADVLEAKRRHGLRVLREAFTAPRAFTLRVGTTDAGLPSGLAMDAILLRYGKRGITANYTRAMDEAVRRASLPYQAARALPNSPAAADPITRLLSPRTEREWRLITESVARKRILLARLAIRAYREEHGGQAPESLRELTSGIAPYLLTVPEDPFSPNGREPLCYVEGNVYSVGENGTDDGAGDDSPTSW